MKSANTQPTNA